MDLFKPSNKILEMICSGEKKQHLSSYEIYPFGDYDEVQRKQGLYLESFSAKIEKFYGFNLEEDKKRISYQKLLYPSNESFKNWVDHTPENLDLIIGIFIGENGFCQGFYDGGDFFKQTQVKYKLENKINFSDFDKNSRGIINSHRGFSKIYEFSDLIEVDSEKGILYIVQFKDNVIAPEGKIGNQYFWELKNK